MGRKAVVCHGHYRMTCSTDDPPTPMSPEFSSKEALARWLVENRVSTFGARLGTYEDWMRVIDDAEESDDD